MTEFSILTPTQVEHQLRQISRDLDKSQDEAATVERAFTDAKYELEIAQAKLIEELRESGEKRNVQEKEAYVTIHSSTQLRALYNAESAVKINRSFIGKLKTQSDIVRSVIVSVRESGKM